jgi:hypothetical protein
VISLLLSAVLAMSGSSADEHQRARTAIAACSPVDERAALRCVDLHLTVGMKQAVVMRQQPEFDLGYTEGNLTYFLHQAWGEQLIGLDRHYQEVGFPATANAVELLLESYWLQQRGCLYDQRERVRLTRSRHERLQARHADITADQALGVHATYFDPPEPALQVTCRKWRDAAR